MSLRNAGLVLASALFLGACATAPQTPVPLAADHFNVNKGGRVGVLVTDLPKPDTAFPGAGCLLCLLTASTANSALTDHARTLTTDELKPLKTDLATLLKAQGAEAVVIEDTVKLDALPDRSGAAPNTARKDFSSLRDKHKIDRLLVISYNSLGFTRSYSAYIATGAPQATVQGTAMMVNLTTHALEWYEPISVARPADGTWDEPPKFPGLTNAYYQALETSQDQVKKPFTKK